MSAFMTAAQSRDLYRRALRPRPTHVTPELEAALIDLADQSVAAANEYAVAMIEQGQLGLATYGYVLKGEFAQGRDVLMGMMGRERERDDDK